MTGGDSTEPAPLQIEKVLESLAHEAAYILAQAPDRQLALIVLERGSQAYAAWRTVGEQTTGKELTEAWIASVADRALVFDTLMQAGLPNAVEWLETAIKQSERWL